MLEALRAAAATPAMSYTAVHTVFMVTVLARKSPPSPGTGMRNFLAKRETLAREEAAYWQRIHMKNLLAPKTGPLDDDTFYKRALEVNTWLAEPFPYRWQQPLSKRFVGADAIESLECAATICARDYLDFIGNLEQMQQVTRTLQDEDSLLSVADKYFGISPLICRVREIIQEEQQKPSDGCEEQLEEQLVIVLQHQPTVWASFLAAVRNELRARAHRPYWSSRLPRPSRIKSWSACTEWRLLQRLSTLAKSLWEAERQTSNYDHPRVSN